MSDEALTPITREETYLAAIAGEDVTVPDPVTRHEEFLAAIDGHVDSVEQDVTDLAEIVPKPAAADEGKVLTAGNDGTASWQTASGGGGTVLSFDPTPITETIDGQSCNLYSIGKTYSEFVTLMTQGPVFVDYSTIAEIGYDITMLAFAYSETGGSFTGYPYYILVGNNLDINAASASGTVYAIVPQGGGN